MERFADYCKRVFDSIMDPKKRDGIGLFLPTLGFMIVSHAFFWATILFIDGFTENWYAQRHPISLETINCNVNIKPFVCERLGEYLSITTYRAHHHYEIARRFQSYQFGFLSTAFWSATMLAVCLFTVVRKGFDDLGVWMKGMLLGLACASAFFGGFPSLISIDQNIDQNLSAYNAYDGITNEVRSYIRTGKSITGNHVDGSSFLNKVDRMLADLPAPRIQFDASKIYDGKQRFIELSREVESGIRSESQLHIEGVENGEPEKVTRQRGVTPP